MNRVMLNEGDLFKMVSSCVKTILRENYLDNIYMSDNFKRWFAGSKMVDKNGRPLLLGHATRSFGFNKFNTPFIHLSSIEDASFFSGGNLRMFINKETLNKLSDEDVLDLHNKYFTYGDDSNKVYLIDDDAFEAIKLEYDDKLKETYKPEEIEMYRKWGLNIENSRKWLVICKEVFEKYYNKNDGRLCYVGGCNGMPVLTPSCDDDPNDRRFLDFWLRRTFPTTKQIRDKLTAEMFEKDGYLGRGGTYPLCARVLNPLHIDCQGRPWNDISITPQNCDAYNDLFDKYCEHGLNRNRYERGSWLSLDNESIACLARELGYDGVVFHNIREGFYGEARMSETYIVFSTKQLKSPFENNGDFGDVEDLFK